MKHIVWAMVGGALLTSAAAASAQGSIYRCGNEYTNDATRAKQQGCRVIEGGSLTIVNTQPSSSAASSAPSSSARVGAQQQQARDNDARAILQDEMRRAQDKLGSLLAEFNDGNPVKSALELRNPQVFNERLEALKSQISRQQSDVAGIERELSRLPKAPAASSAGGSSSAASREAATPQ